MRRTIAMLVLLSLLTIVPIRLLHSCSWAEGYFHQVTLLKGRVVGRNLHKFGPLGEIRWLRQRPVSSAQLTLYKYVQPFRSRAELFKVANAIADSSGYFDFGTSVPEGHYYMEISKDDLNDWFDVEITKSARPTKSVSIDISPNYPDCTGGHEFIVYN